METRKIHGLASVACLAFVTTACESRSDGVTDRRPTAMVVLIETDGRGGADNGGASCGIDGAASETAYKLKARKSNRRDVSDNERSGRRSGKKSESGKKDKPDKKHEPEKEDKPEQEDKSHKEGESGKRESGKAGPGSSERSALRNYYFDDDDDEIVTPDRTLVDKDDPIIVIKTHNGVVHISSSGGIVRVEGDVKEIDIYESNVDVIAGSAAKVRILGSDVDVFVQSVSSVHFGGSDNDVCWTDGPVPSVTDNGAENEIRRARPAPARQPQTANTHYHQVTVVPAELTHASQRP